MLRPVWLLYFACLTSAAAHDIPSDLTVHAFIKPDRRELNLLVRVPLAAIRDVDFPRRGPGYLDVDKLAPLLPDAAAIWIAGLVEIYEGSALLTRPRVVATQISLPSDPSFVSYQKAFAHVLAPKPGNRTDLVWNQVLLDVLFEYPIHSERSAFSIRPRWDRLAAHVVTAVRFLAPGGTIRAYEFAGDPALVHLDPRWHQAALRFVDLGFLHILHGSDHLLFLLCLVIPLRRFRTLIPVVTAFTIAHSFTLIATAYGLAPDALWFPPLIETLIAASIVYMALENIAGEGAVRRRWFMAFGFGLVHGFGFSFALRQTLQFAGTHLLTSLLAFNLGVELGQFLVLLLLVPLLEALFRHVVAERMGTIILSALVAHTGWHWMLDRADNLRRFRFELPTLSLAALASATGWLVLLLILGAMAYLVLRLIGLKRDTATQTAPGALDELT